MFVSKCFCEGDGAERRDWQLGREPELGTCNHFTRKPTSTGYLESFLSFVDYIVILRLQIYSYFLKPL